jgi:hypothetical protein
LSCRVCSDQDVVGLPPLCPQASAASSIQSWVALITVVAWTVVHPVGISLATSVDAGSDVAVAAI